MVNSAQTQSAFSFTSQCLVLLDLSAACCLLLSLPENTTIQTSVVTSEKKTNNHPDKEVSAFLHYAFPSTSVIGVGQNTQPKKKKKKKEKKKISVGKCNLKKTVFLLIQTKNPNQTKESFSLFSAMCGPIANHTCFMVQKLDRQYITS